MIDSLILARTLHLAATLLAAGTVAFVALVADPAKPPTDYAAFRRQLVWMVWMALGLVILSGIAWLLRLTADIYGAPVIEVCLHGGLWSVLGETRFGQVCSARLALALLLGVSMLWPAARAFHLVAAAGLLGLLAPIGHAGATPGTAGDIHLFSDLLHLLAAGAWLGALPALALLLARAGHHDDAWRSFAAVATRRFSVLGVACVAVLLASGLINCWNLVGGPRELVATEYGRLVLLKMGIFAAMLAVAAVNRLHLTPRLPAPAALRALCRNSLAETTLGFCVLAFVGVLGTLSPSNHAHSIEAQVPTDAAFVHIHTGEAMAEVTVQPGRAGIVAATIRLLREDFSELPANSVELAFDLDGGSKVSRPAAHLPDGNWQVNGLELTQAGVWTVRLIISFGNGTQITLDAPIVIER